jgi:anti-sigma regulatory factor (Ser/Thr protein kinase)
VTETIVMQLDPTPAAVKRARDAMDRFRGQLSDRTIEDARLLISELVTNSLRHASLRPDQPIEITFDVDGRRLHVEVVDHGSGFVPRPSTLGTMRGSGWGLVLVAQLATTWGTSSNGDTRVWFELESPDPTGDRPTSTTS